MRLRCWTGLLPVVTLTAMLGTGACFFEPQDVSATGGAGATGGNTGSGGTGAQPCPIETCPKDACNDAICVEEACGLTPKPGAPCGDKGELTCGADGKCVGCAGDAAKCNAKACHRVECPGDTCAYTPDASATCGTTDNPGTCDTSGNCGLCNDGTPNGAELGLDCGPAACGECDGSSCLNGAECKSGHCSDQRCCDKACDGNCEGCREDLTGETTGTCAPLLPGTADDAANPICGDKGGCGEHGMCACEDGELTPGEAGVDCGGTCTNPSLPGNNACHTASPCLTGNNNDCLSAYCVDGFCCDVECGSPCFACNLVGLEGLCTRLAPGTEDTCGTNNACNGSGACDHSTGQPCGAGGDNECASALCLTGTCVACGAGAPCGGTKVCADGYCVPGSLNLGQACFEDEQCASTFCRDGVCCNDTCQGDCMACRAAYTFVATGTCAPIAAGADPQDECQGTGPAASCSGASPDASGDSPCGSPLSP